MWAETYEPVPCEVPHNPQDLPLSTAYKNLFYD